jgi:hypothetical protein
VEYGALELSKWDKEIYSATTHYSTLTTGSVR